MQGPATASLILQIKKVYPTQYLRLPTVEDVKSIVKLHKVIHQVDGLLGSLDCFYTMWKNCRKAWPGSYTGKRGAPSILWEAVVDYHMIFGHASYSYTGNIRDLNALKVSSLLDSMVGGTIHQLETDAAVVLFKVIEEKFTKCLFLWTASTQIFEICEEHQGTHHSPSEEVRKVAGSL
jgi:hypothetical protein